MENVCTYLLKGLIQHVFRYRRDVARTNLEHSFPGRSPQEIRRMEDDFYRHFAEILREAVRFGRYSGPKGKERLRRSGLCTIEAPEAHAGAFRRMNGMMVLTSHCGNWELLGGWFAYAPEGSLGYTERDIAVVYKRLSSDFWERVMTRRRLGPLRGTGFDGYVESRNVLRYALEHKDRKKVFVFPTDQYPYKGAARHETDDFLHQRTLTMTGGAALAHKLGMGVVYHGSECIGGGRYRWKFITICEDASTMEPTDIMNEYYRLLQQDIEAQPWNWLWTHKRWKNLYSYEKK